MLSGTTHVALACWPLPVHVCCTRSGLLCSTVTHRSFDPAAVARSGVPSTVHLSSQQTQLAANAPRQSRYASLHVAILYVHVGFSPCRVFARAWSSLASRFPSCWQRQNGRRKSRRATVWSMQAHALLDRTSCTSSCVKLDLLRPTAAWAKRDGRRTIGIAVAASMDTLVVPWRHERDVRGIAIVDV
jgi:hypothetical protein